MTSTTGFDTDHGFHIFWQANQPHEIHLLSNEKVFNSKDEKSPGLWVTFSCNPKSANYHPQNFNRCARALVAKGLPAPHEVEEHDRRLNMRAKFIAAWKKAHGQS